MDRKKPKKQSNRITECFRGGTEGGAIARVARLQNEVGTKYFFRGTNFLTKKVPKFPPNILSLDFVGPKESRKIPIKFPFQKSKKNHRGASAGAVGEAIVFHFCGSPEVFHAAK